MSDGAAILKDALDWYGAGLGVALATVVKTWGSAPRAVGAKLAVAETGHFVGSVSGGCVEGAVIEAAQAVIKHRRPVLLTFGVSDETAWSVGLACGGTVEIYVEALGPDLSLLTRLMAGRAAARPGARVTRLKDGVQATVTDAGADGPLCLSADLLDAVAAALTADQSRKVSLPSDTGGDRESEAGVEASDDFFIDVWNPPLRLILVGAVHIAQALAPMARTVGYQVTVIDPRTHFAGAARFQDVALVTDWPDAALAALAPDRRTAIVALTHDPKLDDPALAAALRSPAFYIGALGSRKNQGRRVDRLLAQGFSAPDCARINGPVGLDLGAVSPAEIAVSILAQMIACLHQSPLSPRPAP